MFTFTLTLRTGVTSVESIGGLTAEQVCERLMDRTQDGCVIVESVDLDDSEDEEDD